MKVLVLAGVGSSSSLLAESLYHKWSMMVSIQQPFLSYRRLKSESTFLLWYYTYLVDKQESKGLNLDVGLKSDSKMKKLSKMYLSQTSFENDCNWYVLYTRPRFERRVNDDLRNKGLETFLPIIEVTRVWSDRKKTMTVPLFTFYVFVKANLRDRIVALQLRGIVRMVSFGGTPTKIPEDQIKAIKRILECKYEPEPYQYLRSGDKVEVVSGPLRGIKGFLVEERGKRVVVVSITAIQQSISIQVERALIRTVPTNEKITTPVLFP